jgi:hypothetical protein
MVKSAIMVVGMVAALALAGCGRGPRAATPAPKAPTTTNAPALGQYTLGNFHPSPSVGTGSASYDLAFSRGNRYRVLRGEEPFLKGTYFTGIAATGEVYLRLETSNPPVSTGWYVRVVRSSPVELIDFSGRYESTPVKLTLAGIHLK